MTVSALDHRDIWPTRGPRIYRLGGRLTRASSNRRIAGER
jgi:hypothetical protein